MVEGVAAEPSQVGLATLHGGTLIGLDVSGSAALYRRAHKKILRGVLGEVYERHSGAAPTVEDVERLLGARREVPVVRRPAPGCGESLQGHPADLALGAVMHRGQIYHLTAAAA